MNSDGEIGGGSRATLCWFKSSYSSGEGGDCVEVAARTREAGRGGGEGGDFVETGATFRSVLIRDSKAKTGPRLEVHPVAWARFLDFAPEAQASERRASRSEPSF
ncbi:DUF397 domain-containing protein [Streptomyces sp. URMC 126]|uniref:DUF397 domain-containing protein n=1 Tax=Streptomyces sp. URMC 126 TaxID=3423401 RepID=UPI003F1B43CE